MVRVKNPKSDIQNLKIILLESLNHRIFSSQDMIRRVRNIEFYLVSEFNPKSTATVSIVVLLILFALNK